MTIKRPGTPNPAHAQMTDIANDIRLHSLTVLSDNHYVLRKADFELRRRDGSWQRQARESYDIGDGAAVLPIDRARSMVLLVRQFRWPAFENGYSDTLIETIAGKLDGDSPEQCAIKEAEEEAGIRIENPRCVFHCFMSPGAGDGGKRRDHRRQDHHAVAMGGDESALTKETVTPEQTAPA
jgi:nudix-type nucleoside diphosphatase (YffH/AdpP family)